MSFRTNVAVSDRGHCPSLYNYLNMCDQGQRDHGPWMVGSDQTTAPAPIYGLLMSRARVIFSSDVSLLPATASVSTYSIDLDGVSTSTFMVAIMNLYSRGFVDNSEPIKPINRKNESFQGSYFRKDYNSSFSGFGNNPSGKFSPCSSFITVITQILNK